MSKVIPKKKTGRAAPDPMDLTLAERLARVDELVGDIVIPDTQQLAILANLKAYIHATNARLNRGGRIAIAGRRLSQVSQAGKSAIVEMLKTALAEQAKARGEPVNPLSVIHLTLEDQMTLKMLYQELLNVMGDEYLHCQVKAGLTVRDPDPLLGKMKPDRNDNIKVLEQRVRVWTRKLNVKAVVFDEIQYLDTEREDAMVITRKLQSFLDHGAVPLILIGNHKSKRFFEKNNEFAARLDIPLKLDPLDPEKATDRKRFMGFCQSYADELLKRAIIKTQVDLREEGVMDGLIKASGGYIGRAARIFQKAARNAYARGAETVEAYDFYKAVEHYVLGLRWIDYNPFVREAVEA